MPQIEDIITTALGLKQALDKLWTAREQGLKVSRTDLLRMERAMEALAMHEALAGL